MTRVTFSSIATIAASIAVLCAPRTALAITYYDLTQANSSTVPGIEYKAADGMKYTGVFTNPSNDDIVGTGVIKPFIRVQRTGGCGANVACSERAYNTDGTGGKGQFDAHDNEGSNWNRSLSLSSIPIVTINTIAYREFILDINENNNGTDNFLSLDKFKLYLASAGNLNQFDESTFSFTDTNNDATLVYDMDGLADSSIGMDYALNSGSGKGVDLVARIPDNFFKTADGTGYISDFVYLYSSFGEVGNNQHPGPDPCSANTCTGALPAGDFGHTAGFEEWSTRVKSMPEPGSLFLLGLGVAGLVAVRKRAGIVR